MSSKLSKKERNDVLTKGYLYDLLDERDYVTKDYLSKELKKFRIEFRKEINEDFKHHIQVLTEHYIDQLQVIFEGLDDRYVLRSEWQSTK